MRSDEKPGIKMGLNINGNISEWIGPVQLNGQEEIQTGEPHDNERDADDNPRWINGLY